MVRELNSTILAEEKVLDAIDFIRRTRNDLIKEFLDEHYMKKYLAAYFAQEIPCIRLALLKAELKELLIAPVNINYYCMLINKINEKGVPDFSDDEKELFFQEITEIIMNYISDSA